MPGLDGSTALVMATTEGQADAVLALLLVARANPNYEAVEFNEKRDSLYPPGWNPAIQKKKRTPLLAAAHHGHANVAKVLLDHGADPNLEKSDDGGSPLSVYVCSASTLVSC